MHKIEIIILYKICHSIYIYIYRYIYVYIYIYLFIYLSGAYRNPELNLMVARDFGLYKNFKNEPLSSIWVEIKTQLQRIRGENHKFLKNVKIKVNL